ncbi:IclR family transcriptional regulator [Pseudarthrobacter sp. SSS035]|uniref:IclR family transcriptional regulator n=1 Tax=Pseudarthrobacter sp. SSS035 TaxID=2931399 RepID=UPI00200CFD55|nr:IclR family transcriptional regulator [Pseudarthrobacter sp. SSS035]
MTVSSETLSAGEAAEMVSREGSGGLAVPSVVQAFAVIDLLADSGSRMRLAEVVSATGLPKTTVHRLLRTLGMLGITQRDNDGFILGPALARYGNARVPNHGEIIGLFYSVIGRMQEELDETVQLAVLTPPDVTFIAFIDSSRSVRLATRLGRRLPVHASATGKALLAFSQEETVKNALEGPLAALTEWTITDRSVILTQLKAARARGWASESQESAANLSCVAVPVLDATGHALAAITVCLPMPIIPEPRQRHLAGIATRYARELSSRISH